MEEHGTVHSRLWQKILVKDNTEQSFTKEIKATTRVSTGEIDRIFTVDGNREPSLGN